MNPIADKLLQAADYIHAHGWTQGSYEEPDGAVCALGAIDHVADPPTYESMGTGTTYGGIRYALREYLIDTDTGPTGCQANIAYWNDTPGRTQDEVEATFRAAAKRVAEAEEAAKVLDDAADYIDKHGLHQGGGWTGNNCEDGGHNYCMLGTIAHVVTGEDDVYSWDVAKMPTLAAQALGITEGPGNLLTHEWSRQIGELTRFSDTAINSVFVTNRLRGAARRVRRDAGITR